MAIRFPLQNIRTDKFTKYTIKLKDRNSGKIEIVDQGFGIETFQVNFTGITYSEFNDLVEKLKIIVDMNYRSKPKKSFWKAFFKHED